MTKILVTGGCGYVGNVVVPMLLDEGYGVRVLDNMMYNQPSLFSHAYSKNLDIIRGDVTDATAVKKAVDDVDYIIHLAGLVGFPLCQKYPEMAKQVNFLGTINVENSRNFKEQPMIYASTGSVYGAIHKDIGEDIAICNEDIKPRPLTEYGKTKYNAEKKVIGDGNSIALRFATAFGLSNRLRLDLLPNAFTFDAVKNGNLIVYDKYFRRTFIHVKDIARSYLWAVDNFSKIKDNVFNVGDESMNCTKEDIAEMIKKHHPYKIIYAGEHGDPDKRDYVVDYSKIHKAGFKAQITLDEGIQELIKGYKTFDITNQYDNAWGKI